MLLLLSTLLVPTVVDTVLAPLLPLIFKLVVLVSPYMVWLMVLPAPVLTVSMMEVLLSPTAVYVVDPVVVVTSCIFNFNTLVSPVCVMVKV